MPHQINLMGHLCFFLILNTTFAGAYRICNADKNQENE